MTQSHETAEPYTDALGWRVIEAIQTHNLYIRKPLIEVFRSMGLNLRSNLSVLEIGCGAGHFFRLYGEGLDCGRYVGVDTDPHGFNLIKNLDSCQASFCNQPIQTFLAKDIRDDPQDREVYDLVFAFSNTFAAIGYGREQEQVLRALRPKCRGHIMMSFFVWGEEAKAYQKQIVGMPIVTQDQKYRMVMTKFEEDEKQAIQTVELAEGQGPDERSVLLRHRFQKYSVHELADLFEAAGYDIIDIIDPFTLSSQWNDLQQGRGFAESYVIAQPRATT